MRIWARSSCSCSHCQRSVNKSSLLCQLLPGLTGHFTPHPGLSSIARLLCCIFASASQSSAVWLMRSALFITSLNPTPHLTAGQPATGKKSSLKRKDFPWEMWLISFLGGSYIYLDWMLSGEGPKEKSEGTEHLNYNSQETSWYLVQRLLPKFPVCVSAPFPTSCAVPGSSGRLNHSPSSAQFVSWIWASLAGSISGRNFINISWSLPVPGSPSRSPTQLHLPNNPLQISYQWPMTSARLDAMAIKKPCIS